MVRNIFLAVIVSLFAILWAAEDAMAQYSYPRISVSPVRGRIGETFSVAGRGFQLFESVRVHFGGKWRNLTADYSGNIQTSFVVPPVNPGVYSADVYFANSVVISSVFEILPPAIFAPTLFMAGDKITIQVWGAVPFSEARVYLNNNEITPSPRPMVSQTGSVAIETTVPSLAPGSYVLSVFKGTKLETGQIVNLIPDPPGKIEKALAPIWGSLVMVCGFDAPTQTWKFFDPALPSAFNTLKELKEGQAYFILVKEPGELVNFNFVQKLYSGWNNIGWLGN